MPTLRRKLPGAVWTNPAGSTTTSAVVGSLSTTSGATGIAGNLFNANNSYSSAAGVMQTVRVGPAPFNVSVSTPLYLVGNAGFAVSTMSLFGSAQCVRYM